MPVISMEYAESRGRMKPGDVIALKNPTLKNPTLKNPTLKPPTGSDTRISLW